MAGVPTLPGVTGLPNWTKSHYHRQMATEVTVHEAKTHLSRLLARIEAGEEIIIRRGAKRSPG